MLILLSPAKTLDFDVLVKGKDFTVPEFLQDARLLVDILKTISPAGLQQLMKINPKLALLNATRFLEWHLPFTSENAKPALQVFRGEVYTGIQADTLEPQDFAFAQNHVRILSGLYGILRPLDLIQPYRLEMGTKLQNPRGKDLYRFWGDKITDSVSRTLNEQSGMPVVNLASDEYFKVIDTDKINADIFTPVFLDYKNGKYKFLTVYGKRARGMMTRFIIENKITDPEELKLFDKNGYYFNVEMSTGRKWVFTRG